MSDAQVTLTIDGKEITVPTGTLVIRAAEQLGTIIPRFCDHPLLDPIGACRQCVVEVDGVGKPLMACTTTCTPDMAVKTHLTSEIARKGQEGTIEFLLVNHPLDCPMCDKGGECPLQDQALEHGANTSRFVDEKRKFDKPVAVSAQVLLDRERCVLCARCTRFSEQISGDPFIELFERGALEQVAIYEDEPYESYFSGNVIQICPVGALTSTGYRFKARPFDQKSAKSTCTGCSAGCSLTVQSRRGEISRQLARTNMAVNEMWSCDKGRFGFASLTDSSRLTTPMVRRGDAMVDADWGEALSVAAAAMTAARDAGEHRVAILTGPRVADEDAYALAKLGRTVLRTDRIDSRGRFAPAEETAALAAMLGRDSATYADVEAAPVTLVVGLDAEEEVPILHLRLRKAWRDNTAKLVSVGPRMGSLAPYAWRRLATDPGTEAAALAAIGRALGLADLVDAAMGYAAPQLDDVIAALRDAGSDAVILVGERAGAGALAAAGKIADRLGAKVAYVPRGAGARGALDAGLSAGLLPGGRRMDDDADRAHVATIWGELPSPLNEGLEEILTRCAKGDVDVLHLVGIDPLRDSTSPELARKALKKVATIIVQDMAISDELAAVATVVLPVTATQERAGTHTDWEGRPSQFRKAVDGPLLVRDDWELAVAIAGIAGTDLGLRDIDAIRAEQDAMAARGTAHGWPDVQAVEALSVKDGELRLITHRMLLDDDPTLAGATDLLATAPAPYIALSVEDAEARGLADGDLVTVSIKKVDITLPLQVESDIVAGSVFVPSNSTATPGRELMAARKGGAVTIAAVEIPESELSADQEVTA